MEKNISTQISLLYQETFGQFPEKVEEIPACGSYRRYYRLRGTLQKAGIEGSGAPKVMATWNADKKENAAFISFARSFKAAGLPVPEIYAVREDADIYLQEDLGNQNLYALVEASWLPLLKHSEHPVFPSFLLALYRSSLKELLRLQWFGKNGIDYSKCTPCPAFHRDAIHWDLNYFKYFFLKLLRVPFDEQALEDDFRTFSAYLLEQPSDYFLYRDFQSANIMIKDGNPYFIDFQGGRRGALQYDVASLLYDAKAMLPKSVRDELADYYFEELSALVPMKKADFMSYYQGYTLCRLMQALGAFGFRGIVEHKPGFKESIPPALKMIAEILDEWSIPVAIPELKACFESFRHLSVD